MGILAEAASIHGTSHLEAWIPVSYMEWYASAPRGLMIVVFPRPRRHFPAA